MATYLLLAPTQPGILAGISATLIYVASLFALAVLACGGFREFRARLFSYGPSPFRQAGRGRLMIELSVVLISRNQAWSIVRLMDSVIRETASVPSKEIILVDSASTDETVELAGAYPIRILRLQPGQPLSPAIGRYVATNRRRANTFFFWMEIRS